MNKDKSFWDGLAKIYNGMLEKGKAYLKLYSLIRGSLTKDMNVLEIGTGTGMIARAVSQYAASVLAIDYSDKMIEEANKIKHDENIIFSVEDSESLKSKDKTFDAVIISNVLHVLKNPEKTLKEVKRVLKNNGILIAPTYMWKELSLLGKIQRFVMIRRGFPIYSQWKTEEYLSFLEKENFSVVKHKTIKGFFNICYVECRYNKDSLSFRN